MTLPTVTELPRKLEPVTPDTFIPGLSDLTSAERPSADAHGVIPDVGRRHTPNH